jgi:hypothetical protein
MFQKRGGEKPNTGTFPNPNERQEYEMKNLKLIKEYYTGLSHKGKVLCLLAATVVVIVVLEVLG